MQKTVFRLMLGAFLLLLTCAAPMRSHAQLPPNADAYGHSLQEWMTKYVTWFFMGGNDTVGKVKFLPLPNGVQTGGSWTPEDPAVLVGHLDVTLKPGTPFFLPMSFWYGETYLPGTPVAENPDPPLPQSVFDDSIITIKMDGKTIISNDPADKLRYFVPVTYFESPLVYAEPTGYGSTSAIFFHGYGFVHQPLSKGKHTLSLDVTTVIPGDGFYPNVPFGTGVNYKNTWTITVE